MFGRIRQYFSALWAPRLQLPFARAERPLARPGTLNSSTAAPSQPRISAVELLRSQPHLSAAELAERAGVKLAYASTLIRRHRPRHVAVAPLLVINAPADTPSDHARIIEAASGGATVVEIARQMGLVPGEVEFALKIARLTKKI